MASSINFLEEKLSESVTKYGVLYDKHFADKLKKIVAWKDVAKEWGPKNSMFSDRKYK